MIQLRFNSLAGTDPGILGPAPFFRIEGPLLQQGPDNRVVGRYFDHHWEIGGRFVSSFECVAPAVLQFEGAGGEVSKAHGPFQQIRFPNGSCYADRVLLAELVDDRSGSKAPHADGHGHWLQRMDLTRWPVMILSAAADVTPR